MISRFSLCVVSILCGVVPATATPVVWDFPRMAGCHEGLAFSDGVTGVLAWGGKDEIRLTVGRADLWDHRGGYPWTPEQSYTNILAAVSRMDEVALKGLFVNEPPPNWGGRYNPYMLPLGRVIVRVPGATLTRGELEPQTGLGFLELERNGSAVRVDLAMSHNCRAFALRVSEGVPFVVSTVPASEQPVWKTLSNRGFEKAVTRTNGFDWKLPADAPVSLDFEKKGTDLLLATRRSEPSRMLPASFADIRDASVAEWTSFWQEGARVKIPDPVLQRVFEYGMYRFGAMTMPDGVPAGLQGPWLEDDRLVPWNGDYHFNINVQECYSPAYRGGHFENLMPLFRMILSWRGRLRDNAKKFVGIDNGYVLPHSVDDRGVCIGGFWSGTIDHASTAWMAILMMRYVRYSRDLEFLRNEAYDFMQGAMNVYRAMMEEHDGRLSIPMAPSPEWGGSSMRKCVGRDPSFQLAAAHRLALDLTDAAMLLGEVPDPMWTDILHRLPAYCEGSDGIALFEGQPLTESHRHHSHLAGLYPFDTVDLSDHKTFAAVECAYKNWIGRGPGAWSGWCLPWASILHTHLGDAEAAVARLHAWDAFFCNPGHGSLHDAINRGYSNMMGRWWVMQMDGQCAAVTAIMELLAHEVNGQVEFFKGCPVGWKDVSFENLALSDGRRVNGRRYNGQVTLEYLCGK